MKTLLKKDLETANITLESENNYLKKQIESMQQQLAGLSNIVGNTSKNNTDTSMNGRYKIGSNWFGMLGIVLNGKDHLFNNYDEILSLSYNDINDLVSNYKYRNFLNQGILYFVDIEDYERFGLSKSDNLNTEYLINLLKLPESKMMEKISELTNNNTNDNMRHLLMYRIGDLIQNKKINIDLTLTGILDDFFMKNKNDYSIVEVAKYSELKTKDALAVWDEKKE